MKMTAAQLQEKLTTELERSAALIKELRELKEELQDGGATGPMPADLAPLREEKLAIDKQMETLDARKKDIQEIFGARLKAEGLVGYTIDRKVRARRSPGTRDGIDMKALRAKHPKIAAAFKTVTPYVSIRIS